MDWPFHLPAHGRCRPPLSGFAEIAGGLHEWIIANVYVSDTWGWRMADRDEHALVALSLHMLWGGAIGRAWRAAQEEPHETH